MATGAKRDAIDMFDECRERYGKLRAWLADSGGAIRAIELGQPFSGYMWRPTRARACEYVADFERIGREALARRDWRGRRKLFDACFVRELEYRRAVRYVGVSEGTFDYWFKEVKRAAGREYGQKKLFPPWRYFLRRNEAPETGTEQQPEGPRAARASKARKVGCAAGNSAAL